MIDLNHEDNLFTLTMDDGENRWNTTFVREFDKALDQVEASSGPAALVTRSSSAKFFSNGLDLDWLSAEGDHPGGDRQVFGAEFMDDGSPDHLPCSHRLCNQWPRLWRRDDERTVPRRTHHA
jgi:enoyl-CoA hydratase/carnithine racemase